MDAYASMQRADECAKRGSVRLRSHAFLVSVLFAAQGRLLPDADSAGAGPSMFYHAAKIMPVNTSGSVRLLDRCNAHGG